MAPLNTGIEIRLNPMAAVKVEFFLTLKDKHLFRQQKLS